MHVRILLPNLWKRQRFGIATIHPVAHLAINRIEQRGGAGAGFARAAKRIIGFPKREQGEGDIVQVWRVVEKAVAIRVQQAPDQPVGPAGETCQDAEAMLDPIRGDVRTPAKAQGFRKKVCLAGLDPDAGEIALGRAMVEIEHFAEKSGRIHAAVGPERKTGVGQPASRLIRPALQGRLRHRD